MFKIIFTIIIILHGLIHILGFAKAFNLAKLEQLSIAISRPVGALWLLSVALFALTAFLFATNKSWWWMMALATVVLSQMLIILSWSDAKFGTLPNIIIVVVAAVSIGAFLMDNEFTGVVKHNFSTNNNLTTGILAESDIAHLPAPVQKYLRYTGSVGKPKVKNFRAEFIGGIRSNPGDDYMKVSSVQYNFYEKPARFFYMTASKMGLPAAALHIYQNITATFRVKLLNWFKVVDAKGEKMTQGETVTVFNDMCFIAPATLIDKRIEWESIDHLTVKAGYTNENIKISATLYFNEKGELINFISSDRYHIDGKNYYNYPWSTPVSDYKEINGYLLPSKTKLIYATPNGDFTYGELEYKDLRYNLENLAIPK